MVSKTSCMQGGGGGFIFFPSVECNNTFAPQILHDCSSRKKNPSWWVAHRLGTLRYNVIFATILILSLCASVTLFVFRLS